jgi:shikimate dehydrogenase
MGAGPAAELPEQAIVGLLGFPLGHSISPRFQQAAFDYLGLRVQYVLWETAPDELPQVVERLRRSPELIGMNVTVPYKEAVMPFLDELEPEAKRIGAVNTVYKRQGRLVGANTDAPAFRNVLKSEVLGQAAVARALLLGAGGAARAVAAALLETGITHLALANRTRERAERLAEELRAWAPATVIVLPWETAALWEVLRSCDCIVNATSIGMRHSPTEGQTPLAFPPEAHALRGHVVAVDLVYNPLDTPFLTAARRAGARTLSGLPILVEQGALAFERWIGRPAPRSVMRATAERALKDLG